MTQPYVRLCTCMHVHMCTPMNVHVCTPTLVHVCMCMNAHVRALRICLIHDHVHGSVCVSCVFAHEQVCSRGRVWTVAHHLTPHHAYVG